MKPFGDESRPQSAQSQAREGLRRKLTWGVTDQLLSSATNFGLSLFGGRLLGPSSLGVIAIGFSAYLIVLSVHRALLSEPLIIVSAVHRPDMLRRETRSSVSATAGLGLATAVITALIGLWIGGAIGRGLLIFAPWFLPALLQDLWRMLLFRDDRGRAATANDAAWLITMSACLAISSGIRADWAVVASWGLGATVSAVFGFAQLRVWGARPKTSWEWVIRDAWPVGRWFVAENSVSTIASQVVVFLLAGLIGATAVGGLRSAEVIFAPLSLLGPAIGLPGLPLIKKAIVESHASARTLALKLSMVLFLFTAAYLFATAINRGALLTAVFGDDFARFGSLIWPIGVQQLMTSLAGGYYLLLKAYRGGKWILLSRSLASIVTLVLLSYLSTRFGILGGAWAMALGASIGAASIVLFASKVDRVDRAQGRQ